MKNLFKLKYLKIVIICALSALLLAAPMGIAKAEEETDLNIFFYLPDNILKYRTSGETSYPEYIAKIYSDILDPELESKKSEPFSGAIIVTLRPKNESKVWYKITTGNLSDAQKQNIESAIKSLDTPEVYGIIPTAFVFNFNVAEEDMITTLPVAPEWLVSEKKMEVTKLIEKAWNKESPQTYDPYAQISSLPFSNVQISPVIPPHVTYKTTDDKTNKIAFEKLKTLLGTHLHDFSPLTDKTMIGTFIGQAVLAKSYKTDGLTCVKTNLPFGDELTVQTQSFASKSADQAKQLAEILSNEIHIQPDATIRKASAKELALIWFFIGWDIQEPLFVVEDKTHKYAFNFTPDGEKLFWVENINKPCMRFAQGGNDLTSCKCMDFDDDYEAIFTSGDDTCS